MDQRHYTVSLLQTEEGFSVWVPGLPGCASQGQTEAEALDNIRDAISEYLAAVDELSAGLTLPFSVDKLVADLQEPRMATKAGSSTPCCVWSYPSRVHHCGKVA